MARLTLILAVLLLLLPVSAHAVVLIDENYEVNAPGEYDAWVHAATSPLVFGPSTGMKFIVAPPVDVPPEPPKGLIISESSPSEIVVIASVTDCPSIRTSTKGSTAIVLKRTVRCVPP